MPETPSGKRLLVWDLPTRLFHWLVVALVATAWFTGEAEGFAFVLHQLAGYGLFIAVVFRLIWGFAGSRHARFRDFLHPWRTVRDYAERLARFRPPRSIGHNPLGGWMVVLILAALAAVLATGAFAEEDEIAGPLAFAIAPAAAHAMAELHEGLTNVLLALIAVHVAGVLLDTVLTRDNLVRAMWTGYKMIPGSRPGPGEDAGGEGAAAVAPSWRAAAALAAAAGLAWVVATL